MGGKAIMPVHDWTRVDDGIYHAFHVGWIGQLQDALNGGLLPSGYYALAEQHAGKRIADVLTLHASPPSVELPALPPLGGGTAVAEVLPRLQKRIAAPGARARRRTLALRHVSHHRLVALLEIISPANKDRAQHVTEFVDKAVAALDVGVHVLVADLFPPGSHDPQGINGAVWQRLMPEDEPI